MSILLNNIFCHYGSHPWHTSTTTAPTYRSRCQHRSPPSHHHRLLHFDWTTIGYFTEGLCHLHFLFLCLLESFQQLLFLFFKSICKRLSPTRISPFLFNSFIITAFQILCVKYTQRIKLRLCTILTLFDFFEFTLVFCEVFSIILFEGII